MFSNLWGAIKQQKFNFIRPPKKWKKVYSVCQLLFLFAGLSSALLSGYTQSLLQGLCFSFELLPVSYQLSGELLTLYLHLHAYTQRGLPEVSSYNRRKNHSFRGIIYASLTVALYRFASSAISTACLTWRQADHSRCCASCWLVRTARRARSNSSRSLKDWQTKKCKTKINTLFLLSL